MKRFGRKLKKTFWKADTKGGSDWMTFSNGRAWLWWVMLGYSMSISGFRIFDCISQYIATTLTPKSLQEFTNVCENVQIKYESVLELFLSAIVPCLLAPLWEELFYRGLIFPWLSFISPLPLATICSAIIFAVHHARVDALLAFFGLGLIWSMFYLLSGSIIVPVIIHYMWNFRVFINSMMF
jgi:membrane protease YdiL (CAAX protease family)